MEAKNSEMGAKGEICMGLGINHRFLDDRTLYELIQREKKETERTESRNGDEKHW